jgi:hypothetical protein
MLKTMEKKPEDRYQSAEDLLGDLKKLAKGVGIRLKPLAKDRERHRKLISFVVIFLLTYLLGTGLSNWLQDIAHPSAATSGSKRSEGEPGANGKPISASAKAPGRSNKSLTKEH